MPNIGVPSKACHLCRKRRVKCDFTKPGCLRCAKLDFACPGYRDEQDLLFLNQDKISYNQKKKSRTPSKRKSTSKQSSLASISSLATSDSTKTLYISKSVDPSAIRYIADPLPLQISDDWNLCSVSIVLHQFSAPICDSGNSRYFGYLDFLPDLYSESADSSCLSLATNAVAKTYISNTRNIMLNQDDQIRTYSQALEALQRALDNVSERSEDSTIICVWLLSMFEILQHFPGELSSSKPAPEAWHRHSEGLVSLLRIRGSGQFTTTRGRNIFWMMYTLIQTRCLVANVECPSESVEWFNILRPGLSDHDRLPFVVCNYNYEISVLCLRIRHFLQHTPRNVNSDNDQFAALLYSFVALESDIKTYKALNTSTEMDLVSIYFSNMLRAAMIKLQHFMLMLADHVKCYPQITSIEMSQQRQDCINSMHFLSRKVLDSVPLLLPATNTNLTTNVGCWADAMRLIWPLSAVSWVTYGLQKHREEARLSLQKIGWQMGIRLALRSEPLGRIYRT